MAAVESSGLMDISPHSGRSRGIPAHFITALRPSFRISDLDEWRNSQRITFYGSHNFVKPLNSKSGFRVSLK